MSARATVITAFYNNLDFLIPVLSGYAEQTIKDFEVIIADDGSSPETIAKVEKLINTLPFRSRHLWQEDRGFRKNRMLNAAIDAADSRYIIFTDADCIPHPAFVEEHLRYAEENTVLTGRRVNLSPRLTNQLAGKELAPGWHRRILLDLIKDGLFGASVDVEKGFYTKSKILRRFFNNKERGLLGCNFSAYKDDLLDVNGFDERYTAPSVGEDTDIQHRLQLVDKEIRSVNNIAVQYHLFHEAQARPNGNLELFEEIKRARIAYTPFGIHTNGK